MIFVNYCGRCGNQMFMYAIAMVMKELYKEDVVFNDYILLRQSEGDASFSNDLKEFNVEPMNFIHAENPILKYGRLDQIIIGKVYSVLCNRVYSKLERPKFYLKQQKWQPFLNKFGIYSLIRGYSPIILSTRKNKFVDGYFEDERWFKSIKDKLKKDFTPITENSDNNELYQKIKNSESVCVTIRRGDFLSKKNKGLRDICNEEYYREAVELMRKKLGNATFFFFSDDIEWVKENYDFGVEAYYETGKDSVSEKMRLMSACKHFVLSNSTFSWWAQYLSDNQDKIVISPDHWFNMPGYKHDLIGDDWILLKC